MLNEIASWYKATTLEDNDERLGQRRRAAEALLGQWRAGVAPGQAVDLVCLGLEAASQNRSAHHPELGAVVDAVCLGQPSRDRDEAARAVDTRICILMALSELIQTVGEINQTIWDSPALFVAQALTCALRHRKPTTGAFLEDRLNVLLRRAEDLLNRIDVYRRARKDVPVELPEPDGEEFAETISQSLSTLRANAELDREELQALWWVFGGYSLKARAYFGELPAERAAWFAGLELSEIVQGYGALGLAVLAARAASVAQETGEGSGLFSSILPEDWAHGVDEKEAPLLANREAVFPVLSTSRRTDHSLPPGTMITQALSSRMLAIQVFGELSLLERLAE